MKANRLNSYHSFLKEVSLKQHLPLNNYIDTLNGFLSLSYLSNLQPCIIYLLDYISYQYVYLHSFESSTLNYSTEFLLGEGPSGFFSRIHPADSKIITSILFPDTLENFIQSSIAGNSNFNFTVTYRLRSKSGEYHQMHQRTSFICSGEDGLPLASLGTLTDISHLKKDSKMAYTLDVGFNNETHHKDILVKYYFPEEADMILSKREIDVLKWVCDGLSSKQIAEKLNISIHTINNHRKNMLEKTNCRNFSELLNHALKHGLV